MSPSRPEKLFPAAAAAAFIIILAPCISTLEAASAPPAESGGIIEAAAAGDTAKVEEILDSDPDAVSAVDDRQQTPLHIACGRGDVAMARLLIEKGADVEARDGRQATCLISACASRNIELIRLLIDSGADIDAEIESDGKVYNALTVSAMYGFEEMTGLLMGMNAKLREEGFEVTLRYAVMRGMPGLVDYVRAKGLSDGRMLEEFPRLIHDAASAGQVEMLKSLEDVGYLPGSADWCGWTPLHYAAYSARKDAAAYLLERGVDPSVRNARGESAWDLAASQGAEEVAELLAQSGADTTGPVFPRFEGPYIGQDPPGDEPELFMPGIVSGMDRVHSPLVFTPDGREAYWTEMGRRAQVMKKMSISGGVWTAPEETGLWGDPGISPDGSRMAFINRVGFREGEGGGVDEVWFMERTAGGWGEPRSAGEAVNAVGPHWRPSLDREKNLYYSEFSDRMYFSRYSGGEYQAPVPLSEHLGNGTIHGCAPFISPQGDYLLFGDDGKIYVSFKAPDGSWLDRAGLGERINAEGTANELPVVSPDGNYIFFLGRGAKREWGVYWVSAGVLDRLREEALRPSPR